MDKYFTRTEIQRFAFIERLLVWRGQIKRGDLKKQFDLSESTAALTFRDYHEVQPGVLVLDRSRKAYVTHENFTPMFYKPSIDDCELPREKTGLLVKADDKILMALGVSIRESRRLKIEYRNLKGDLSMREIFPLALINMVEGFPPALHAWCYERMAPRTFQLPFIQSAKPGEVVAIKPSSDELVCGRVEMAGISAIVSPAAIHAVAGQLFAVPEFRDSDAREAVDNLAARLKKVWVASSDCHPGQAVGD
ncbi:WYL domain-containing protein [Ferrovum sp.]|uniref:WYL domain-containing protein n=1 Tax=Ferrovum sp. TaxID=2609467 RepID=UPI00260C2418|nr:WYL domain-containing protein [Ferrovum sp.]